MYEYSRVVRVADTDASGVIYFANMQMIALEGLEDFLQRSGASLGDILTQGSYLLPIVHVEANYLGSVTVGDHLKVQMVLDKVGTSSFTFKYTILSKESAIFTMTMTQVTVSKITKKSMPIPQELLSILERA